LISAIFFLEDAINHRFLDLVHRKISESQIFAKGSSQQIKTQGKPFFEFRPQISKYEFFKVTCLKKSFNFF
jgi:hypothetical protein